MENIIFSDETNGILVGQNIEGEDVFFDIKNSPSLAIFDKDKE